MFDMHVRRLLGTPICAALNAQRWSVLLNGVHPHLVVEEDEIVRCSIRKVHNRVVDILEIPIEYGK